MNIGNAFTHSSNRWNVEWIIEKVFRRTGLAVDANAVLEIAHMFDKYAEYGDWLDGFLRREGDSFSIYADDFPGDT